MTTGLQHIDGGGAEHRYPTRGRIPLVMRPVPQARTLLAARLVGHAAWSHPSTRSSQLWWELVDIAAGADELPVGVTAVRVRTMYHTAEILGIYANPPHGRDVLSRLIAEVLAALRRAEIEPPINTVTACRVPGLATTLGAAGFSPVAGNLLALEL